MNADDKNRFHKLCFSSVLKFAHVNTSNSYFSTPIFQLDVGLSALAQHFPSTALICICLLDMSVSVSGLTHNASLHLY